MGVQQHLVITSDLRVDGDNLRKVGNDYVFAGDNISIVSQKQDIINIDESSRIVGESFIASNKNETLQFIDDITDNSLTQIQKEFSIDQELIESQSFEVNLGNRLDVRIIQIEYALKKNGSMESGTLKLSNADDTTVHRKPEFDDIGVSFFKSVITDDIILTVSDDIGSGNVLTTLTIKRIFV